MEPTPEPACGLSTRWSDPEDCDALAEIHAAAWRYAYAGVIPEPGLSRMIARRRPAWWRRQHAAGGRALLVLLEAEVAGYALIGRSRDVGGGEIRELYVRPDCQGLGFGGRLFAAARAEFRDRGIAPLHVWCLAANRIGTAFYLSRGGRVTGRARDRVAGADLEKLRFTWG